MPTVAALLNRPWPLAEASGSSSWSSSRGSADPWPHEPSTVTYYIYRPPAVAVPTRASGNHQPFYPRCFEKTINDFNQSELYEKFCGLNLRFLESSAE